MDVPPESDLRRHREDVWAFLRVLGAPRDIADDLTQEVFLRYVRFRSSGGFVRSTRSWLRTAARNAFIDSGRQARGGLPIEAVDVEQAFNECRAQSANGLYTDALRWAMQRLRPRQRDALRLRYQPGGSRGAVAVELGLTDEGAKTLLRRARQELMTRIKARMNDADF